MNNRELYESESVVAKYTANTTRVRSLNNPERELIDRFDIKNKDVLVIGCGAGRVPANLLLYGNRVIGVDRSRALHQAAQQNFPPEKFTDLQFVLADAVDLSLIPDNHFDTVLFPMNALDYLDTLESREIAIDEAGKKLKPGGLLAFSSHNKRAYAVSPKVRWQDRHLRLLSGGYRYETEGVTGGGRIFKGDPSFVIRHTCGLGVYSFLGHICDTRNKVDRLLARKLSIAQWIFPYVLYVFQKN